MSLQYIREMYNVPAKRHERVTVVKRDGTRQHGVIVGSSDSYIRVRLDGEKRTRIYHPTDGIVHHSQP